jgi:haloalkane dehalogenase
MRLTLSHRDTPPIAAAYRTPDDRFEGLTGFPYEPVYRTVDGLRLAHVDAGEGPPVLLLHGSPTWSYIWRKVIPPVLDAGYRCVAPDHAGYGRSDKPIDPSWHSLERHVNLTEDLLERLDLRDATLVVHDWGGPIGLNAALRRPDRVARIVILDTVFDAREAWMNDAWVRVRDFVLRTEELPAAEIMRATFVSPPDEDVIAAYQAPFPVPESVGALKGMMAAVPAPDDPATAELADRFYGALRSDERPMLILWADADLFLTLASGQRLAARIGRTIDHVITGAGHSLQEDRGELIGRLIADWLPEA